MKKPVGRWLHDPFPAISHWSGAVMSVVGTVALAIAAWGRPVHLVAALVYGVSMITLFTASGLAHSAKAPKWIERLNRFDYAAIFVLIAGTYTPICLLAMTPAWGISILVIEWVLAVVGVLVVTRPGKFPEGLRVWLYILMGWLGLLAGGGAIWALPGPVLACIVAGGIVYTVGAVVFFTDRPNLWPGRFVAHDLWHVMVMVAAGCHFAGVSQIVVGA